MNWIFNGSFKNHSPKPLSNHKSATKIINKNMFGHSGYIFFTPLLNTLFPVICPFLHSSKNSKVIEFGEYSDGLTILACHQVLITNQLPISCLLVTFEHLFQLHPKKVETKQ